ncbi:DUF3800 domain-containing protein [Erysipelothrix rhusiopathiae]|uniref:DUF3800 domain-containing protein n=1 Tax=Erysipelothrix rhusiopathiae TaxID=1648 RepID=UPI0039F13721
MNNVNFVDVFCDESCHLENDNSNTMVIGAMYCRNKNTKKIYNDIKRIKIKHGFNTDYEIKWVDVKSSTLPMMLELVEYFFTNMQLRFRCYIIDKSGLNHYNYNQNHDTFYYKMMYRNLEYIIDQGQTLNIYLDIKDTRSSSKTKKLGNILNNYGSIRNKPSINRIQTIQSHESQILQLSDLLIGAIRYKNEGLQSSKNKMDVINKIESLSSSDLIINSTLDNFKFNLFHWNLNSRRGEW